MPRAPVHVNFPFDEPLVPDIAMPDLFDAGRVASADDLPALVRTEHELSSRDAASLVDFLDSHTVVVLAGEGTFSAEAVADSTRKDREVQALLAFAERFDAPLLADPLSHLRTYGHPAVICGYDRIMGSDEMPAFDAVVRFGRYPVSKRATQAIEACQAAQIVVDPLATRDFNSQTTTFVAANPLDFVVALLEAGTVPNPEESMAYAPCRKTFMSGGLSTVPAPSAYWQPILLLIASSRVPICVRYWKRFLQKACCSRRTVCRFARSMPSM